MTREEACYNVLGSLGFEVLPITLTRTPKEPVQSAPINHTGPPQRITKHPGHITNYRPNIKSIYLGNQRSPNAACLIIMPIISLRETRLE